MFTSYFAHFFPRPRVMRLATGALAVCAAGIALAPASGFGAPRTLVTTGAGVASARLAALSPSGIGPIRFGMTLSEGTAAADLPVTSVPGINGCSEWRIQGLGTDLELVAFGGRLEYALAYSSAIRPPAASGSGTASPGCADSIAGCCVRAAQVRWEARRNGCSATSESAPGHLRSNSPSPRTGSVRSRPDRGTRSKRSVSVHEGSPLPMTRCEIPTSGPGCPPGTRSRLIPYVRVAVAGVELLRMVIAGMALGWPAPVHGAGTAAAAGCGGVESVGTHNWHEASPPPLALGDSTMLLSLPELSEEGFDGNAQGCTTVPRGTVTA